MPAGINAVVAGIGWFAVNSVSGAFALNALLGWNSKICLLIIVLVQVAVAFFGHNLVHMFERVAFPFLVVVFAIASVVIVSKSHPGWHAAYFFANQSDYTGVVPTHNPHFRDIAFEVGFVLAALLYALFFRLQGESIREETLVIPGEQPAVPVEQSTVTEAPGP